MYTILDRQPVLKTPWLSLFRERVQIQGQETDFYVTENGNTALVLAITTDRKLILVREYRHPCRQSLWQLPGGHINNGESVESAARRELLEETGYGGGVFRALISWFQAPWRSADREIICVLDGVTRQAAPHRDTEEQMSISLVELSAAVQMVLNGEFQTAGHALAIVLYSLRKEPKCPS